MDIQLLTAGYCTQLEIVAKTKGKFKTIPFPATFLLIQHPTKGIVLFDTGYSQHVLRAMKTFPFQLYKMTTPVYFKEGESAKEQLEARGIQATAVRFIILSHFHADHMGGLRDFPNATFICSGQELEEVKQKTGFRALKSAYIPALLPTDFHKRAQFIEELPVIQTPIFSDIYPEAVDLFGDGSILGIALPGHTSYQFGIFLYAQDTPYFFIADACWLTETFEKLAVPSQLAKHVLGLGQDYYDNINKLHALHTRYPHVKIIPCHERNVTL